MSLDVDKNLKGMKFSTEDKGKRSETTHYREIRMKYQHIKLKENKQQESINRY